MANKVKVSKVSKVPKVSKAKATTPTMSLRGAKRRGNLNSGQALRLRSGQLKGSESNRTARMTKTAPVVIPAFTPTKEGKAGIQKKKQIQSAGSSGLTVKVFDIQGKSAGTTILPKEIFGQKPNSKLLSQAIRVYQSNQIPHTAHTKTRGEVHGGGRKPWRQKGTGRARAGSIRSPLWVGGGTVFGPRYRDIKLHLPKKMKHKALVYALSDKAQSGGIKVITGIEKIAPKTKVVANLLAKLETPRNVLLVISQKSKNVNLATRNIQNVTTDLVTNLNAYEVIKNNQLLISKEALSKLV